ncbi:MAG: hypothetical protein U5N26_09540 [Candidatus Marinimicrobia bacterium]|nr:hypothetical protein [Candidatus Neomarinimicrobiota bacterium]
MKNAFLVANSAQQGGAVYSPEDKSQSGIALIGRSTFVENTAEEGSALFIDKRQSAEIDSCVFPEENSMLRGEPILFAL